MVRDLPQTKSYYLRSASVNVGLALQLLMRDCVQQAQENDGVDFKQFAGINVMLNDTFGCCAWGGSMALNIDGENIRFRTTWLPPWAYNSLCMSSPTKWDMDGAYRIRAGRAVIPVIPMIQHGIS